MKYRGFNITSCTDTGIERHNYSTHRTDICNGYYCQIYSADDDTYTDQLDDFCLAAKHEIPDCSDLSLTDGIIEYVNHNVDDLKKAKDERNNRRKDEFLGKLVCWLGENESGAKLYDTLHNDIQMKDTDILNLGFSSLVPFFNREYYAESIAEYIYETGTEQTTSGNWIIPFSEIGEKFAVDLCSDSEMLNMICNQLDRVYPVADMNTDNQEFDIVYYLAYCPNAEDEEQGMEFC